jgi:catechol 2,3-dioxygenase-like lactoylglutathione lyase family enzyme
MPTVGIDHVAFPVSDVEQTIEFYRRLGFGIEDADYRAGRSKVLAIRVGPACKINIHPPGLAATISLRGPTATPGCADLCFVWDGTFEQCEQMLADAGVALAAPPKEGGGARAGVAAKRLYARDPDGNLLEWMVYS